ncbi:hypothetical protein OHS59_34480 [Streptomyces sp. NBC_00414]|uniref:hypothetical protein n=1 Tax=Streptomyces sp. NBC_00414 TaxID=2975739 RepID=UPI002E1E121D
MGRGIMLLAFLGTAAMFRPTPSMSADVTAVTTALAVERRTLVWLAAGAGAALALLLALFVLAVRRTRVSPARATAGPDSARSPGHRAAPRPPPRRRRHRRAGRPHRTATVRTELRPQGYVELDHCLHRAEWTDSGTPPPAPGAPVDVTDPEAESGNPDVLLALPHHRRPPAAAEHP